MLAAGAKYPILPRRSCQPGEDRGPLGRVPPRVVEGVHNERMSIFLETEWLLLRRFHAGDLDSVVELDSDPQVTLLITGERPTSRALVHDEVFPRWFSLHDRYPGYGYFAAIEKASGDFLGWFLLRPNAEPIRADGSTREGIELGYRLRRAAWGKGYATEGARALISKGFTELGAERIYAEALAVHGASRRVMEKAGLRYVGPFRDPAPDNERGLDPSHVEYALTKLDWALLTGG